jgi:tetratricopeptide (TPR) repeat protein
MSPRSKDQFMLPPGTASEEKGKEHVPVEAPRDVMARARELLAAGDSDGALAILQEGEKKFDDVPPPYDAMLGRLLLQKGDARAAIGHLNGARVGYGPGMPVEQRRDLAAALLLTGRIEGAGREFKLIEQGGGKVVRQSFRAAIEAYKHRESDDLDKSPPTPYRVLAEAEIRFHDMDIEGARKILDDGVAEHGERWGALPPAFDALRGRLCLRNEERADALTYLTRARDAWSGPLPIHVRHPLGVALFETGQISEAARELNQTIRDGGSVGRAELLIAINSHRAKSGENDPMDVRFARNVTIVDPDRKLAYVSIAKNACTFLKTRVILNSRHRENYLASTETIHRFCGTLIGQSPQVTPGDPEWFKFVVLRHPLSRILSAYLDKFVRLNPNEDRYTAMQVARTVRETQASLGLPEDPARSITFEEFVHYLAATPDEQLDMHWMPQYLVTGTDLGLYDHVGTFEHLSETLEMLVTRFGFREADGDPSPRRLELRRTRYNAEADVSGAFRLFPQDLAAMREGYPPAQQFYAPELEKLVRARYAADIALHEAALRRRGV